MESSAKIQLRIPAQDLRQLTFDGSTPKKLAAWIEELPMVNVGETSRQLYAVVQEINRLQTDAKTRYQLLEVLRNPIHYVCKALGKHFLNQSIILPEKESKIANLAQALQNHLAVGYKVVLVESLSQKGGDAEELRKLATHRALCELSGNLLRCYQLYYPTPKNLWLELHQLYLLATHYDFLNKIVVDETEKAELSILDAYTRTVLLCTSRPNQLRQREIAVIYKKFGEWSKHCKLLPAKGNSEPFVIDLSSDSGPIYGQWANNQGGLNLDKPELIRFARMHVLADKVNKNMTNALEESDPDYLSLKGLAANVTRHLAQSWSASSQRAFARTKTEGILHVAFGLGAVHHYISNGQDFNQMLLGKDNPGFVEDENPFLNQNTVSRNEQVKEEMRKAGDVWSLQTVATDIEVDREGTIDYLTSAGASDTSQPKVQTLFPSFPCNLVDTSPGGYCVQWNAAAPAQLKTGEVIAVRESSQDSWSIAAIRWIKKMSNTSARLGIELLAPHAEACGAKVVKTSGDDATEYMRAIRLPELKAIGQPSTLIMPQMAFRTGYKVVVNVQGDEARAQLLKEVGSTASFSQFEYKILGNTVAATRDKVPVPEKYEETDEFGSLWTSL